MFADRWHEILKNKGRDTALWFPGGELSFQELHDLAQRAEPAQCPVLGSFFLAQGDALPILVALLAGLLRQRPVQIVEKDRIRRVPVDKPKQACALIKQTVGSSGVRRCQFFTTEQVFADVDALHAALGLSLTRVALAPLSVAHSFGLTTTILQTLFHGLPTHWLPTPFPAGLVQALAQHEEVFLPGVPAMWKAWLLAGMNISPVRLAVSAGSPLTLQLEQRVREEHGLKLHNLFGTSECGSISFDSGGALRSEESQVGQLLPGVRVQTLENGRLHVSSPAVGLGYDEVNEVDLFHGPDHLTWDLAEWRGGQLHWRGCCGAGINVASRKLSPAEIEAKITAATGLDTVKISGTPSRDPERVQDVVCELALPAEQITQSFKTLACQQLAPWEVPRRWISLA